MSTEANLIDFESQNEINFNRAKKRKQMDKLLEKAQRKYEAKEKLKQKQIDAILPEVHLKVADEQRCMEKALKKKTKKHKKSKKSKKHHSHKSSDESVEDEGEWVEKTNNGDVDDSGSATSSCISQNTKVERQSWMLSNEFDFLIHQTNKKSSDQQKQENNASEELGRHTRELNPFWKNGGTGLLSSSSSALPNKQGVNRAIPAGNDGGLAWWSKALMRCKEMAEEQNKSLEEVAADRYGSLDVLKNRIKEAELFVASSQPFHTSRKSMYPSRTFQKSSYGDDYDVSTRKSNYCNNKEDSNRKRPYDSERKDLPCRWKKDVTGKHEPGDTKYNDVNKHADIYDEGSSTKIRKVEKVSKMSSFSSSCSSSDAEEEEVRNKKSNSPATSSVPVKILSNDEKNKLSASILKAELLGNMELASELKKRLDASNKLSIDSKEKKKIVSKDDNEDEGEILMTRDTRGNFRPYPEQKHHGEVGGGKRRRKHKVETYKDGVRMKYFEDDDKHTMKSLYEQEKLRRDWDGDAAMFNKLAGKAMQQLNDDEYAIDDELLTKESRKKSDSFVESRQKQQAIIDQKKMSHKIESCQSCFNNTEKHLIVSIGSKVYLSLPRSKSMVDGHCLIVAMQHTCQSNSCDEDVYQEIMAYKKSLVAMFKESDEDIVFMETCKNLRSYPHLTIECIPLPREEGDMAPIYFKKAIAECGSEWSQNKKLIEIKNKTIRQSVPTGFPYFHVAFGLDEGFAHVIEDESTFPQYFGREIVGGMLDIDATLWRKPRTEKIEEQIIKVTNFAKRWRPHDFTLPKSK